MTGQQILTKAVQKAIDGGWEAEIRETGLYIPSFEDAEMSYHGDNFLIDYNVIFNHDFARAIWGECITWVKSAKGTVTHLPLNGWQYHLQQMVIAEDPIKYLVEYL